MRHLLSGLDAMRNRGRLAQHPQTSTSSKAPRRARTASLGLTLAASLLLSLGLLLPGGGHASASASGPVSTDGMYHLSLIPGATEVRYLMTVRSLGKAQTAACTTRDVTGDVVLTPEGAVVKELSKIVVDQRTLQCEEPLRNSSAQSLLGTEQHPYAEFVIHQAPALTVPFPVGPASTPFIGEQTVKGVTRPATYNTNADFGPEQVTGIATTQIRMTEFGIKPPRIGPIMSVDDTMTVEFHLQATTASPPLTDDTSGEPSVQQ